MPTAAARGRRPQRPARPGVASPAPRGRDPGHPAGGRPAASGGRTCPTSDADRDDPDADDHSLGGAQLLERELGASIIEEIKHD